MSIILGLCGENCSGKGTVADYLIKRGFYYFSLSDIIREELAKSGIEPTRDNMVKKGNELRETLGPSILAKRAIEKLEKDRNYVIDSIRNPFEVEELKKVPNFSLIYVSATPEIRFARMKSRAREGDAKDFKEFLRLESLEQKNANSKHQNIEQTVKLATLKITNEGNLQNLFDKIDETLATVSKEFKLVRPSWDNYFMNIAKVVASRSNCMKRKVAAVIVMDKRIISTGYNGTPRGVLNCSDGGCPRCNNYTESGKNLSECICSHGEENAIVQAANHGIAIKGAMIYSTFSPCLLCTKMIINSGIKEVVYNADYELVSISEKLLNEAGIIVRKVKA
ncbi:MAG: deaminase [Candidatus Micrarchaeota archaeon]